MVRCSWSIHPRTTTTAASKFVRNGRATKRERLRRAINVDKLNSDAVAFRWPKTTASSVAANKRPAAAAAAKLATLNAFRHKGAAGRARVTRTLA